MTSWHKPFMGLDIAVYTVHQHIPTPEFRDQEDRFHNELRDKDDDRRIVQVWDNENWPGLIHPLEDGEHYRVVLRGNFRAGSYSGYSSFRSWLCQFAMHHSPEPIWSEETYSPKDSRPFYQLINFSDCEGTIGATACAKLAKDFEEYLPRAIEHFVGSKDTYDGKAVSREILEEFDGDIEQGWGYPAHLPAHYAKYRTWYRACRVAGDNGFLVFC